MFVVLYMGIESYYGSRKELKMVKFDNLKNAAFFADSNNGVVLKEVSYELNVEEKEFTE